MNTNQTKAKKATHIQKMWDCVAMDLKIRSLEIANFSGKVKESLKDCDDMSVLPRPYAAKLLRAINTALEERE